MSQTFFDHPILNSPYAYPDRHWELDADGQPTNQIIETRRRSDLITPVPKPKKRRQNQKQGSLILGAGDDLSSEEQEYNPTPIINEIRTYVEQWRNLPPDQWLVTPETARLLQHWRHNQFQDVRPFFCQIEAVETAIWLTEVASKRWPRGGKFWEHIKGANGEANPELIRLALKLATGAGKTTVMAMLIAWQTVNAVRHPNSKQFSRGFLIVAPGITIRDRLRVLLPNDPESYYRHREIVPPDMLADIDRAKIVITNYHAFKLRERISVSKGTRQALEGWRGETLQTLETEGQMLQRVMPELMGMKRVVVLNDEAHHCYREKVTDAAGETEDDLKGEEKDEAKKNNEAARLWISGLEAVKRKLGLTMVYDLSATPFFLRGSGYAEGTLFPWTMSDFSLMDAIECGIVKLPRVPVADNVPGGDTPKFRNLWEHIGKKLPKKGRGAGGKTLDPLNLPAELLTALEALYGHYQKTFDLWSQEEIGVPPVFIVVCNNTSTSELIYKYISGFHRENDDGSTTLENGRLALFRNYDDYGNRLAKPNTILIDSAQLESGEALDKNFHEMAADEIDRFRRELVERTGDIRAADNITDQDLLREVMNTVGKKGKLGEQIRCVVSVSMLTEGWDANTVTHILGVRAFGTQLLCEQVVGRALRRQSYDLNENDLFNVEYADVLGIPFDFAAKPVVSPPAKPRETVRVHAVRPDRDALEITFPRVEGYRVELPDERLEAHFGPDHVLELTPGLVGPSVTKNQGIIGEGVDLTIAHLEDMRASTILFHLTRHLLYNKFRDPGEEPKLHLFGQLKRITRQWLEGGWLRCSGGTYPAQLLYKEIADMAAERIKAAITEHLADERPVKAILDAYNPTGSTRLVNFTTSKETRWQTRPDRSHINWVVCDGDWEAEFCRVVEDHPRTLSYVKNQSLGLEVPYLMGSTPRKYIPDFIVRIDDGHPDPLNLVVEIKGYRGEDAKEKANTMKAYWVPGVNNLGKFGRWAFAEFTSVYEIEREFKTLIETFCTSAAAA
ncbi:MAG: DEAD/DEAH box helicase family protein [Roseitalea sp.]|nr:DEAD/DEAH box helicase family protein [Roseitalea sp.]MBO6951437.1 DEAD/DEAH box helicase family protein [Rhizobiaceae bacterium]MBO6592716.1 DEAD/DEAH box helicase family protein [Roseitalea sp.]MBO6598971.1 DEAD/DEAH box helicase family protein [Roseitalea sp.]MBO6611418.1 DEAD/DEAH box helicase family protein [Roseitalea sp.]